MTKTSSSSKLVLFQDYLPYLEQCLSNIDDDDVLSPSEVFFELANKKRIGYQLLSSKTIITIQQTNTVGTHTGGIVWETSYLLANYLLSSKGGGGRVLEVGSGCGMLGLLLAATNSYDMVVVTETTNVLPNLQQNVQDNLTSCTTTTAVHTRQLRWDQFHLDVGDDVLKESFFDLIVGTDVIFTPTLVRPLLQTLRYMSHDKTIIYICVQIRCQESHTLFLNQAPQYNFQIKDISTQYHTIPSCAWGKELDCILFQLTTSKQEKTSKKKKKKEKKRKFHTPNDTEETNHFPKKKKKETKSPCRCIL